MAKSYGVRFYAAQFGADAPEGSTATALLEAEAVSIAAGNAPVQWVDGMLRYEFRDIRSHNAGQVIQGVLAVLRDEAPHIRGADGAERPIELQENEHVIEKNYFLLFRQQQLLVWQVNGRASHVSRMERMVTLLAANNYTVTFGDVVNRAALQRLEQGTVKRFEVRLARPRNAEAIDPNNWERSALELMAGVDGTVISIEVSTRRKGRGLSDASKALMHRLLNRGDVRKLAVKLDRERLPVDLFADCVHDRIEVQMDGLYPIPRSIFEELQRAKDRQQPVLDDFFGGGGNVLV